MIVELERGPRFGSLEVASKDDEVWLRYLGGKSPNIRLMDALYTYSRTEDDKVIFRYRRSREIESNQQQFPVICNS